MNREKKRPPSRALSRAQGLVRSEAVDVDNLLKSRGEEHHIRQGFASYVLTRPVSVEGSDNFLDRQPIKEAVNGQHSAELVGHLAVSLFGIKESKKLLRKFGGSSSELKGALDDATHEMPYRLSGHLGNAFVIGQAKGKTGTRYVSFGLRDPLGEQIQEERDFLSSELGVRLPRRIPHVSLLKTNDQQLAEQLSDQINYGLPQGTPISLESIYPKSIKLDGKTSVRTGRS